MTVGKHETTVVVKGQTFGASKGLRALAKEVQKTEGQVDKLSEALRRMTDKKRQSDLEKAAREMERLKKASLAKAFDGLQLPQQEARTQSLLGSVTSLRAGLVGLGGAGVVAAVNTVRELGAESLKLQNVFANLPFSLKSAQQATLGLVDNATLATAAVQAQRFGVAENAAEFAKLADVATKLSVTTGQDAAKGIEDLTLALSRQSPMILDNLGISLKLSEAHDRYAASLGKTAAELTDAEKAEAFRVEAMKAAEAATKGLAVETDGLAFSLQKAEVSARNMQAALLTGGGPGGPTRSPGAVVRQLAQEAGEVAAQFDSINDALREGTADQQATVERFLKLQNAMENAATRGADLREVNEILRSQGAEIALTAEQASGSYLKALNDREEMARLEEQLAIVQGKRADQQSQEVIDAREILEGNAELVPILEQQLRVDRASGVSQKDAIRSQIDILDLNLQTIEAKRITAELTQAEADAQAASLQNQREVLEAQLKASRSRRRGRRGPSREDEVKRLVAQADAGDRLAQAEAARMEMLRSFHEEDTSLQAERLEMVEGLILARERALDIEEARGELSDLARYNREQEILQFQIEAEQLREQMAFDEDARLEAAEARDVLLHDQRLKRIQELPKAIKAAEDAEKEAIAATQAERDRTIGLTKDTMQSLGTVLSNAATARNEDSRAAFVIEKGIKSAELALDAVLYGTKSVSAFAAQNYFQGIAFAAASAASATGAVKMLAQTPESASAEAGGGGGGAPAGPSATPIDRGGAERPGSNIPASPVDSRGGTLPGAGAAAGGGGVSVSIGQFTTLGTVDDETGAKLAQAIERVKEDGLA